MTVDEIGVKSVSALPFRCLLLDHDDTTVRGTEELHFPAHCESLVQLQPHRAPCTLEEWFAYNHEPGISAYLKSIFPPEQHSEEHAIWHRWIEGKVPTFYEGMPELLAEFKSRGGLIAVISHSPASAINHHYEEHPMCDQIRPDLVLGWDDDPAKRKPAVWPAHEALKKLGVSPAEALVLDDLSPGVKMAKAAGVTAVASGWGHDVPVIREYMQANCHKYFATIAEFRDFLLPGTAASTAASTTSGPEESP